MKRGTDQGYFPKTARSLFILDTHGQEEAARRKFVVEGIQLNFVSGSRYIGSYLGPYEELEAWAKPQLEAWAHRVRVLGQIARQNPQSDYFGLVMSLQL